MDGSRLDRISKVLVQRRVSRRQALATGGAGLVAGVLTAGLTAGSAQDATPDATPEATYDPAQKTEFLFVQTFQSGTIAPLEGSEGRYTLTLETGTGQTVYFADRPDRTVGATDTADFLEGLGFLPGNPPNAALVVETAPGETDIAVVELFHPHYDPVGQGVTYEVEVLANWQDSLEMGFSEVPTDLAALAPSFGAAHLFIDDCPNMNLNCVLDNPDVEPDPPPDYPFGFAGTFYNQDMCWNYALCIPCEPYGHNQPDRCATYNHWIDKCTQQFLRCSTGEGPCYLQWNYPGHSWLCY